jgi:uncharacterized protein (TIGR00299 family) protein
MRIAYLDCASGISGDMTLGALVDAGIDLAVLQAAIDSLGMASCRLVATEVKKRGFRAAHVQVEHEPEHAHRHLHHIEAMIDGSSLTPRQRELAKRIFARIGEAEAKVHGTTIQKVHFHEVGAVDSIADVVGAAVGWDLLGVDTIVCSPIPTGTGYVEIAHGRCSIPAPATAEILRGVPLAELPVEGELTTPTGAAIATTLADRFGPLPAMRIERIGYGAGTYDFPQPNILRLIVGELVGQASSLSDTTIPHSHSGRPLREASDRLEANPTLIESICVLETNLDDATGELMGHVADRLLEAGALDVSMTAIQMKKGRPGVLLTVQCRHDDADRFQATLLEQTPTLGVRRSVVERRILPRRRAEVATKYGRVEGMVVAAGPGAGRFAPEYESCRRAAELQNVPLIRVYDEAAAAYRSTAE